MRTPGFGESRRSSTSGVWPIAWTMSAYLPPHGRLSRRGSIIASKSVVAAKACPATKAASAAGHRRQDHQRVSVAHGRIQAVEHADVLVVQVDVHVAVELAVLAEQLPLGVGVLPRERAQDLADVRPVRGDLLRPSGRGPENR